jgi:hypothetical protein
MRSILWLLLLVAGCAPGKSVLSLSVSADPPLAHVSSLSVTVTETARMPARHASTTVAVDGSLPPQREVSLVLPADISGVVTVDVAALDGTQPLGSASKMVAVHPSEVMSADLTLAASAPVNGVNLGDACTRPCSMLLDSCSAGFPGTNVTFPDGYCSTICDSGQKMSNCTVAGGDCEYVQGLLMCLQRCHPSAGTGCRAGYDCCDGKGKTTTSGWCAPSNSDLCVP